LSQIRTAVFPDRLSEKVESLVDMSDVGLLRRECQPSLVEKGLHQRCDFVLQQLFASAGDDEVIRPPHHIDHAVAGFRPMEPRVEALLQPIESQIH
jgi:hypothetical protein